MTITVGDLALMLTAKTDQLDSDLSGAKQKVTGWAGGISGTISKALGGAVLAGTTAVAGAVVGIGAAAFSAASEFDAASKKIQSQLGATDEAAAGFKETLKDIYANNFGDSITDVADSITKVELALKRVGGTNSSEELQKATEAAIALRDTFDVEVNESTEAAAELMDKFGLSANQAFDFIAGGYQKGLDSSGDFLDSITEYSTQFSNGGATAGQFFSLLESGLQAGALGTDKAADAFKEFRIRIGDGSKLTSEGLTLLGLNSDKVLKDLSSGAITSADAFQLVLDKLKGIEDPNLRLQAGVALLGTQFEDLGDSAVAALSLTSTSLSDVTGSVDRLNKQYDTLPAFFEGLKRRAIVAITPIGDALLGVANEALPYLTEAFDNLETQIQQFIANSNFEWTPEFKQIKLGDLFEFISTESATTINLGDYVSFVYNKESGGITLKAGDLFTFETDGEGGGTVDLAGYFSADWTAAGITKLTISDLLEFGLTEDGGTINLASFFSLSWDESGITKLGLGGILEFADGEGIVNLAKNFSFAWDEAGITKLKLGSFLEFAKDGTSSVNLGEYMSVSISPDRVVRLKIGDVIDASGSTASEVAGGVLSDASAALGKKLEDAASNLAKALGVPVWLQSLIDWKPSDGGPQWLTDLMAYKFAAPEWLTNLTSYKLNAPEWLTTLTGFKFTAPEWLTNLTSYKLTAPEWLTTLTGYQLAAPEWLTNLTNYQLTAPEWLTSLTSYQLATPEWLTSLLTLPTFEKPEWLTGLLAYQFPSLADATSATINGLVAWVWPDAPTTISDLLAWVWPDAPTDISSLLKWIWPDFGAGLTSIINSIIAFQWPKLERPDWIDALLNFKIPTPAWVTSLLNWRPSLPQLPSWLGGGEDTAEAGSVRGSSSSGGSFGPDGVRAGAMGAVGVAALPPIIINVGTINNGQDVEEVAYRVASRLAYGV